MLGAAMRATAAMVQPPPTPEQLGVTITMTEEEAVSVIRRFASMGPDYGGPMCAVIECAIRDAKKAVSDKRKLVEAP